MLHHYMKALLYITAVLLLLSSCSTSKKSFVFKEDLNGTSLSLPESDKKQTLFLLGDTGTDKNYDEAQSYLLEHLRTELQQYGKEASVVFLGDNIYPAGLPKKSHEDREKAEQRLNVQLDILKELQGEAYFIPGNHDWNQMSPGGLKAVKRQEKYIQEYHKKNKIHFYPNDGCGDPVVKKIGKDLYYIFIDTQWWLQNWNEESKINQGCHVKSRQEFLEVLQEQFLKHKNDQIVVMMHHPLFSNGEHGGNFSAKTHLFPLQMLNKNLWLPLPILGSIMPIYRSLGGVKQDMSHPLYQELKNDILAMLLQNKHVIFASGHDHNLQYFKDEGHHYIVSGAGSKTSYAKGGGDARFVRETIGYSTLHFYDNGSAWLDFVEVNKSHPSGQLLYRKQIVASREGTVPSKSSHPPAVTLEEEIEVAANAKFEANGLKRFFLGNQYRNMWTTPVQVPIIHLDREHGGLTPIRKGGGMASNSLRLQNESGAQFNMRSVVKDYGKLVPPEWQDLKVLTLLSDMNSASHPYGALVVAELSKAANIYYARPRLLFLKRQSELGFYNDLFKEELYMLEDRPAGDASDLDNFGNSSEIISYLDLLERQTESNEPVIDQEWVLRSRLFDLVIHDWDRHDDQWRWAKFEIDGDEVYRPIPRDRDQAFYKFDGLIPQLVSWQGVRKFRGFKEDLRAPHWQSFNARYFDRYFMNELEWTDWQKQIQFLQEALTDLVIEESAKALPKEVQEEYAPELIQKLKSRRDKLESIAKKLYDYLSIHVSIPGSNEDERFEVERLENGDVQVQVFELSKKHRKKEKVFERTFKKGTTKEIRLYGRGGKDEFEIDGEVKRSIPVRIIGGYGKDIVDDDSKVAGLRKMTLLYDEPGGFEIKDKGEIRDLTGGSLEENEYNRLDHLYDQTLFLPVLGYTPDDKVWLGANFTSIEHGFRKDPYSRQHAYGFSFSPSSRNTLQAHYEGDYIKALFNYLDLQAGFKIARPLYTNYFGLGNDITIDEEREDEFYWLRQDNYEAHLQIKKSWIANRYFFNLGPKFLSSRVKNVANRITDDESFGLSAEQLKRRNYFGATLGFQLNELDNLVYPRRGLSLESQASLLSNPKDEESIQQYDAALSFYLTFGRHLPLTIASRTGWAHADGDLQFYQYPTLGNNNALRGFRNDQFRGNHVFYQNLDLRLKLANWKNNIAPMQFGLITGYDIGRVWLDGESPSGFHHGYTLGAWFNLLSMFVLQPHVSFSEQTTQFNFRTGFNF